MNGATVFASGPTDAVVDSVVESVGDTDVVSVVLVSLAPVESVVIRVVAGDSVVVVDSVVSAVVASVVLVDSGGAAVVESVVVVG